MASGIPLSWLIQVNSTGVRDTFSLSKLPTLLITRQDNNFLNPLWNKFYNADEVIKKFGNNTSVSNFANNYFSVTNKNASKPDLLNVFNWNENATASAIQGAKLASIEALKSINGAFSITIQDNKKDININLSDCVSYSDVANKIQEAIQKAGEPLPTTLQVQKAENSALEIQKGDDGSNTQVLTINATNYDDVQVENSDDTKATFDKESKTITGVAEGSTILSFIYKENDKNKVRIDVNVEVSVSPFNITTTIGNLLVIDTIFEIETNAGDFNFEIGDDTKISFDKDTKTLVGLENGVSTLTLKAKYGDASEVTKAFNVTIAQNTLALTINEQSQRKARALQAINENPELPAFTNASVIFDTNTQGLRITSGISGADSTISFIESPTQCGDISSELGLTEKEGATIYQGLDSIQGLHNVLSAITEDNGAYYLIAFDWILQDEDIKTLGNWLNNQNSRYASVITLDNNKILTQKGITQEYQGFNGLIIDYAPNLSANGFSAGLVSALDFSQINGNSNLAFNDAGLFDSIAITKESELNYLESNLCNSILRFSQIGQSTTWYGMGNIMGNITNSANVFVCNSYLALQLQLQLANMFGAQGMIGLRGSNNEGIIRGYIDSVLNGCVNNGIIVQGAELTTTESQKVLSTFVDKGESAITQCQNVGYFYILNTADLVNQTLGITLAYVANKAIKKLVVTNFILGA